MPTTQRAGGNSSVAVAAAKPPAIVSLTLRRQLKNSGRMLLRAEVTEVALCKKLEVWIARKFPGAAKV